MNIQILPNYSKKIGLLLYFIGGLPSIYFACTSGLKAGATGVSNYQSTDFWYYDVVMYFGILIYFLSKEKVEDDYINKLRLESFQFTAVLGILITFILFVFSHEMKVPINYFLEIFLLIYLISFYFKKRADL